MDFSCTCMVRASSVKACLNNQQLWKLEVHPEDSENTLPWKHPKVIIIMPLLPFPRDICFHSRVMSVLSQELRRVDGLAAPRKPSLLMSGLLSWNAQVTLSLHHIALGIPHTPWKCLQDNALDVLSVIKWPMSLSQGFCILLSVSFFLFLLCFKFK